MKTCDKYDIDRFLSSLPSPPPCLYPPLVVARHEANLSLCHIYSVISFFCWGPRTSSAPPSDTLIISFAIKFITSRAKCLCVCVCLCWFRGVIFGQPPVEQEEKLGLICDKVRVALALGKRTRLDCGYPPSSCSLPLPLSPPPFLVPFCYLSTL